MSFIDNYLENDAPEPMPKYISRYGPDIYCEDIPGSLQLGIYYSNNEKQLQVAQVAGSDRATHLYVVGATGTGKTKFLEFLIRQDIESGNGFGVIDPHGDLIEDIKGFLACRCHWSGDVKQVSQRVVLIDPTDPEFTVTFNPLEKLPGISVAEQAGELVSAFRKIWADSWGARMEDLMRNTLIALGEAKLTLAELTPFLTHRAFRQVVMEKVANPTARDYFRRFDTQTDRAQITWIEPVMNKINAFLADERMRQMFSSSKTSFNLREIMDKRKWLIIKLNKGKLKDSADLAGSLFMAKIQMAAFSRADLPVENRVPFYLYIDEFQNFATDSFKVVLSEARKYGLSLVMAHQSLSQISDDLRGLILGSAGLQVYFRVNRQDAQLLAKEAFEYSGYEVKSMANFRPMYWSYAEEWEHRIEDIQHLPPRECYASHKLKDDIIRLKTVDVQSAPDMLGMRQAEYSRFLKTISFGSRYLVRRDELASQSNERQEIIEAEAKTRSVEIEKPVKASRKSPVEKPETIAARKVIVPDIPCVIDTPHKLDAKLEREHRRLQHLIKRLAEQCGYKATIEQPTNDGQGRIDVGLESDNKRIACEICVTTPADHELQNIRKCLDSKYDIVILCSPDRKSLHKVKILCEKELTDADLQRVRFIEPDALMLFFEEEAAKSASNTTRVKGYKVKINFQPQQESEKMSKRRAITKVILNSLTHNKPTK